MGAEWTAPDVERRVAPTIADERASLDAWLDYHRATLLAKCAGLTADQLKQQAVPPSTLSLLGLIRHLAEVERSWFQRRVAGRDVPFIYSEIPNNLDGAFDDVDDADAAADFACYEREVEAARAVLQGCSLDETFFHPRMEVDMDVRWVVVHMLEEYARHNGHADLLRERIDGAIGM
jgi:uncharacterized damage-inducible protein DinB